MPLLVPQISKAEQFYRHDDNLMKLAMQLPHTKYDLLLVTLKNMQWAGTDSSP
jgi:hypothetical protein